eukprot:gene3271-5130_t
MSGDYDEEMQKDVSGALTAVTSVRLAVFSEFKLLCLQHVERFREIAKGVASRMTLLAVEETKPLWYLVDYLVSELPLMFEAEFTSELLGLVQNCMPLEEEWSKKLLGSWRKRGLFPADVLAQVEDAMRVKLAVSSGKARKASAPAPQPAPPAKRDVQTTPTPTGTGFNTNTNPFETERSKSPSPSPSYELGGATPPYPSAGPRLPMVPLPMSATGGSSVSPPPQRPPYESQLPAMALAMPALTPVAVPSVEDHPVPPLPLGHAPPMPPMPGTPPPVPIPQPPVPPVEDDESSDDYDPDAEAPATTTLAA